MTTLFSSFRRSALLALVCGLATASVVHAAFPDKPARMVIGYAPGSSTGLSNGPSPTRRRCSLVPCALQANSARATAMAPSSNPPPILSISTPRKTAIHAPTSRGA